MKTLFDQQVKEFCCSIVHDLKMPITQISLSVQLLEQLQSADRGEGQFLEKIDRACRAMLQQIEAIQELFFDPAATFRRERVDVSGLAVEIAADLRACYPGNPVRLKVQPDLTTYADRRLLRLVLLNLLENAWKFTAGAVAPQVEIGMLQERGIDGFYVADNGSGFPAGKGESIPLPLEGGNGRAGKEKGKCHGVGLLLVRRIIQMHGGEVWAGSEEQEGSRICFTIPAACALGSAANS